MGHALLLGGDDVEGQHREHGAVHRHRHAHLGRAGCRRTAGACRGSSRSPRRPCRRRRRRAGGRCRSRGAWPGRRRPTGPSGRRRGCGGRRRWTPRRWRSRRTGGSSTAGWRTSSGTGRAGTGRSPGRCARKSRPARSAAVYSAADVDALGRRPRLAADGAPAAASRRGPIRGVTPGEVGDRRRSRHLQVVEQLGEHGAGVAAGVDVPRRRRRRGRRPRRAGRPATKTALGAVERAARRRPRAPTSCTPSSEPHRHATVAPRSGERLGGGPARRCRGRRSRRGCGRTSGGPCARPPCRAS